MTNRLSLLVASLALLGAGCSAAPVSQPSASVPAFGAPQTIGIGETAAYPDGLQVTLKAINDSRCKPGATCVWAGELAPVLSATGGAVGNEREEISLGMTTRRQALVADYAFAVQAATETTATISVVNGVENAAPPPPPTTTSYKDLLAGISVVANQKVSSPLVVTGKARGNWYFEASFPAKLYDANDNLLVAVPAQAQGDWMTTDFVPFSVTLAFPTPATATGTLVLEKDNPSGEPQFDDSVTIPVQF